MISQMNGGVRCSLDGPNILANTRDFHEQNAWTVLSIDKSFEDPPKGRESFTNDDGDDDDDVCRIEISTPPENQREMQNQNEFYVTDSYQGDENNNEAILTEGEVVQVIQTSPNGWWLVSSNHQLGWAPSNFLAPVLCEKDSTAGVSTVDFAFSNEDSDSSATDTPL